MQPKDLSLSIKKRKNSDAIKELGAGLPFSPPSCLVEVCEKVGLSKYFFNREGRPSYLNRYYMAIKKDRSKYTLFLICMCVCSIAMCQNLMAPNLTEIALSYNITNELERDAKMGGSLSTAFFVFSMPFFLTIGYLTDRYDRKQLLLLVTILNAVSTMCTAFSSTFFHLFLLRILSGATVMSVLPLGYSVLGDLFPPKSRGAMGTWLIVSMGAGTIVGQLMSGLLGPTLGWRTTFVFASFPGMLMTWFCHHNLMMPKRGDMDKVIEKRRVEMIDIEEGHAGASGSSGLVGGTDEGVDEDDTRHSRDSLTIQMEDEDSFMEHTTSQEERAEQTPNNKETKELLKVIFSTKTNLLLFAQCIPGSIPWGVLFVFMNDFLAQDKGLTGKLLAATVLPLYCPCTAPVLPLYCHCSRAHGNHGGNHTHLCDDCLHYCCKHQRILAFNTFLTANFCCQWNKRP